MFNTLFQIFADVIDVKLQLRYLSFMKTHPVFLERSPKWNSFQKFSWSSIHRCRKRMDMRHNINPSLPSRQLDQNISLSSDWYSISNSTFLNGLFWNGFESPNRLDIALHHIGLEAIACYDLKGRGVLETKGRGLLEKKGRGELDTTEAYLLRW